MSKRKRNKRRKSKSQNKTRTSCKNFELIIALLGESTPELMTLSVSKEFKPTLSTADGSYIKINDDSVVLTKGNAIALLFLVIGRARQLFELGKIDYHSKDALEVTFKQVAENINNSRKEGEKVAFLDSKVYPKAYPFTVQFNIPSAISFDSAVFNIIKGEMPSMQVREI